MRYLLLILLALLLSATPARAGHDLTAAWAPPYGYAVVWRGLAPDGACVVRTHPAPETVLGCDGQATYFLYVEDGAMGGMVFELRDGSAVLATATLGGRLALPDVVAPE
jgi:hypothetical protein